MGIFSFKKNKKKEAASEERNPEDEIRPPPSYGAVMNGDPSSGYGQRTYGQNNYEGYAPAAISNVPLSYGTGGQGESRLVDAGPPVQQGKFDMDDPRAANLYQGDMERKETEEVKANTLAKIAQMGNITDGVIAKLEEGREIEHGMMHNMTDVSATAKKAGVSIKSIEKGNRAMGWALPSGEAKMTRKLAAADKQRMDQHLALDDQLQAQQAAETQMVDEYRKAADTFQQAPDTSKLALDKKYQFDYDEGDERAEQQEAAERMIAGQDQQINNGLRMLQLGAQAMGAMVEGSSGRVENMRDEAGNNTKTLKGHNWNMTGKR